MLQPGDRPTTGCLSTKERKEWREGGGGSIGTLFLSAKCSPLIHLVIFFTGNDRIYFSLISRSENL